MFDIKTELNKWKCEIDKSEHIAKSDIEEMETHLVDSVEELQKHSLNEEEAFLVAVHRLGKPEVLEPEFQKAHPKRLWQNRFIWMLTGILLVLSTKATIGLVSKLIVFGSSFFTVNFSILYFIELGSIGILLLLIFWFMFKLAFSDDFSEMKYMPARLKPIHYICLAFLVSVGQFLPENLRYWMGKIHHDIYWEIWSDWGGYLTDIQTTGYLINSFIPLVLLVFFIVLNRSYKRVNG